MSTTSTDDQFASTGGINPAEFASDLFPSATPNTGAPAPSESSASAISSDSPAPPAAAPTNTPAPTPAAAGAAADAGMTAKEWDALPKSWKRELEAEWKATSETVRRNIYEREGQYTAGVTKYKQGHDAWDQVISPFQEVLKSYPDANVPEILATLANNHLMMVQASPAEKMNHVLALAKGYGVDLTPRQAAAAVDAAEGQTTPQASAPGPAGFTPEQVELLNRTLAPVMQSVQQNSAFVQKQLNDAALAEVDKFFSDPKNKYVSDVASDMIPLMKTGQVKSLSEAYEFACLRHPMIKAQYMSDIVAATAPPPSPAATLPNVKSSPTAPTVKKSHSIDETIDGVIEKHFGSQTR